MAVGLILVIVGLTGSILVFNHEIDAALIKRKYAPVISQSQTVSLDEITNNITLAYAERTEFTLQQLNLYFDRDIYVGRLRNSERKTLEVFVNSHTGNILGDRLKEKTFFGRIFELHYSLFAGDIGFVIVGIAALLLFLLTVTGLVFMERLEKFNCWL